MMKLQLPKNLSIRNKGMGLWSSYRQITNSESRKNH